MGSSESSDRRRFSQAGREFRKIWREETARTREIRFSVITNRDTSVIDIALIDSRLGRRNVQTNSTQNGLCGRRAAPAAGPASGWGPDCWKKNGVPRVRTTRTCTRNVGHSRCRVMQKLRAATLRKRKRRVSRNPDPRLLTCQKKSNWKMWKTRITHPVCSEICFSFSNLRTIDGRFAPL